MKLAKEETLSTTRDRAAVRRPRLVIFLVFPPFALIVWALVSAFWSVNVVPALIVLAASLLWLTAFTRVIGGPQRLAARLSSSRTLRAVARALDHDEIELHYQPQIDLRSGRPYAVEALARWRRRGELVQPDEFLPAVEGTDLIDALTHRILGMALAQAADWQREGSPIGVAVNLSAANLRDFDIVDEIERLLALHEVRPELLTLEVTETTVLEDPERTRAVLDAISALGVALAVDDFGIGHSSLLRLNIFPVDEIKIDRSFVSGLPESGRAFVEGAIRLAADLSMRVVAEGVENEATLEELQALGCGAAQGFLFSPPLPADQVAPWFRTHTRTGWARHEETLSITPDFERLPEVRALIERQAATLEMSETDLWDVRVAATEGVANAIEHGIRSPDGLIHIRVAEIRGELLLEISGGGREPGAVVAPRQHPGGRGITIMNETMDLVRLTHGRDGNLIRMTKSLPTRPTIPCPEATKENGTSGANGRFQAGDSTSRRSPEPMS